MPPHLAQPAPSQHPESETPPAAQYVRHSKRPKWGLGALLSEHDEKRTYRFEDGEIRSFKAGFFHFLDPVRPPDSMTQLEIQQLNATEDGQGWLPGLRAQLALFLADYPGGFADSRWLNIKRGVAVKRALKRHREPVMATAARVLAAKNIDKRSADGEHALLWDEVTGLLASTDLVPSAHTKHMRKVVAGPTTTDAHRIFLYGTESEVVRFDALRRAIGADSWTWPVISTLRGLVDPLGEVPIRPSVFAMQAKAIAHTITAARVPSARTYEAYLRLARHVRDWLVAQSVEPKDLIDVHDFIWETLRPAARKRIAAAGAGGVVSKAAAAKAAKAAKADKAEPDSEGPDGPDGPDGSDDVAAA